MTVETEIEEVIPEPIKAIAKESSSDGIRPAIAANDKSWSSNSPDLKAPGRDWH